ncbi:hypothetical protein MIND_01285800 [Mycena indigotica]|uniref:Uncharacterized protein n=1 Tax=Mycena indigotica TaxID=2126181 RepID=A0A8H6S2T8_9AGAR|nr:uncharacterized protein MIND_01285800 [Mycena indigotica]KAF7291412.1 hypothetical protein MIND_01285800 [Mycena indigotica]
MAWLRIARIIVLGAWLLLAPAKLSSDTGVISPVIATLFGLAALGLGAALADVNKRLFASEMSLSYAGLAIASGVLTLVVAVPILVWASWVAVTVEIPLLFALALLWVTTGGLTVSALQQRPDPESDMLPVAFLCSAAVARDDKIDASVKRVIGALCGETRDIAAFGVLNFVLDGLFDVAALDRGAGSGGASNRGVWTMSVVGLAELPLPAGPGAQEMAESASGRRSHRV